MLIKIYPIIAEPKLETINPLVKDETIIKSIPFKIKVKSPKLIILMGKDKINNTGFIKALARPKTIEATIAAPNPLTYIPFMKEAVKYIAVAFIKILAKKPLSSRLI